MSLEQKVETFTRIINIVKTRNDPNLLYEQIRQLFSEFDGASKEQIIANKDLLASCIVEIIQTDEHLFELGEISEMEQIKVLFSEMPNLQKLTSGIISGDVNAANEIYNLNKSLLEGSEISDIEDIKNKIRYSCITSIADENTSMSFSDLSVKLLCSEEEIETLFITAIEFGYLDALIDESNQHVYFR